MARIVNGSHSFILHAHTVVHKCSLPWCVVIAGNINQSLMVLRNCIEILRENQKQAANKVCA